MKILLIILIITSLALVVADCVVMHYQRQYNRLLEQQNELLWKLTKESNEILRLSIKENERK